MRKRSFLIIGSVIALSSIMLISAALLYTLNFNMNTTVAESGSVTVTIDSTTYTNGQSLSINWSSVTPGQQYNKAITIHNGVNNAVTPALGTTGLPSGWSLTLSDTSSIPANSEVTRNIVLTVPSGALAGTSSWTAKLTAST